MSQKKIFFSVDRCYLEEHIILWLSTEYFYVMAEYATASMADQESHPRCDVPSKMNTADESQVTIQTILWANDSEKPSLLLNLLNSQIGTSVYKCDPMHSNPRTSTLILATRKRTVEMIAELLERHRYSVTSVHGGRMQAQREEALKSFQTGRTSILVATDVVIRGLDILCVYHRTSNTEKSSRRSISSRNVKHLINFDLPSDIGYYRERLGRAGKPGE